METVTISKFKATCLALLDRVRRTGQPIRVTRRGEPIADVVPPARSTTPPGWLGALRGTARITGDVVGPVVSDREWEVLKR